jgi:hypothetical protein
MMKSLKMILVLVVLLTFGLSVTDAGASEQKGWTWPDMLIAASGGVSSPGYVVPIAWTPEHEKDAGVKWRVLGEPSTLTRIRWLNVGKIQFWYTDLETGDDIIHGDVGLITKDTGPHHIRIALPGFTQPFGLVTFGKTGIKTIEDLRNKPGTTYGVPISSSGIVKFYQAFRAFLGMSEKELVMVPFGNWGGLFRAMGQGKINLMATDPTSMFIQRFTGTKKMGGPVFLDWPANDPGNVRFQEIASTTGMGICDIGASEARGKRMIITRWVAFANKNQDPELIYRLIKWHAEAYDKFKDKCPLCPRVTMKVFRDTLDITYVPVHEGVIRYMKEIGQWSAADDARQAYNLKLLDMYIKAYGEALAKADAGGIKVTPENKAWTDLWINYKKEIQIPRVRIMTDQEIAAALPKL